MILKGSQRAGGWSLASHLMNDRDNDHVKVLELRGFMGDTLHDAFTETEMISKATKCEKYLYSLSLSPPIHHCASEEELIAAIERAEQKLGLDGQPRAIVIHEKEGRRHTHVVWSRIDAKKLKAVQISHDKRKLMSLSKELFLDHGWELPKGLQAYGGRNPLNFTLVEWQQAKRLGIDPREIKQTIRECWESSDNKASFIHALEDKGLFLARGDRRGFVVMDVQGQVYSLSRWSGVATKEIKARLGLPDALPSVEETRRNVRHQAANTLKGFIAETRSQHEAALSPLKLERDRMVAGHRAERKILEQGQEKRWRDETHLRQARLNTGMRGVFDWISGKANKIRFENEKEAYFCLKRDQHHRQTLVETQMQERRTLQQKFNKLRAGHQQERQSLAKDVGRYLKSFGEKKKPFNGFGRGDRPNRTFKGFGHSGPELSP